MLELLGAQGAVPDSVKFCPHLVSNVSLPEYAKDCNCRKPGAGMAEAAAREFSLDLRQSVVVGDSGVDTQLGRVIGGRSYLVRTGYGKQVEAALEAREYLHPAMVQDSLSVAVDNLLGEA